MIAVQVRDEDAVEVALHVLVDGASVAAQMHEARAQDRIGDEPRAARLDEQRRVPEEGDALGHRRRRYRAGFRRVADRMRAMSTAIPPADVERTPDGRIVPEQEDEHPVSVLELFFDLVFVLAITQVTLLLAEHLTVGGLLRGLLVLALLWWSWVGYSWLTNSIDVEDVATRVSFFVAMAAFTVVALSVPHAFGDDALSFAGAYAVVRAMQVGLYAYGTDDDDPNHGAILTLAPGFLVCAGLIIAGAIVGGEAQAWIWLLAIVIDVADARSSWAT